MPGRHSMFRHDTEGGLHKTLRHHLRARHQTRRVSRRWAASEIVCFVIRSMKSGKLTEISPICSFSALPGTHKPCQRPNAASSTHRGSSPQQGILLRDGRNERVVRGHEAEAALRDLVDAPLRKVVGGVLPKARIAFFSGYTQNMLTAQTFLRGGGGERTPGNLLQSRGSQSYNA